MAACIFCKIIKGRISLVPHQPLSDRLSRNLADKPKGDIPSFKLFESERVLAFLDIQPLSQGHAVSLQLFHPTVTAHAQ